MGFNRCGYFAKSSEQKEDSPKVEEGDSVPKPKKKRAKNPRQAPKETPKIARDEKGRFLKGQVAWNRGTLLEEWVGEEEAKEIKKRESEAAKDPRRVKILASMNNDPVFLKRRNLSRAFHDEIVGGVGNSLREKGVRIYILSSWVTDARPDIILFKNEKLYAIELEQEKGSKPSMELIRKRKSVSHGKHNFFDELILIPFNSKTKIENIIKYIEELG